MNFRTAISTWAGAGAAENARRSLDEWSRAQDEVSAMLNRLGHGTEAQSPTAARPAVVLPDADMRPGSHGVA
jgi:hypothetical protein